MLRDPEDAIRCEAALADCPGADSPHLRADLAALLVFGTPEMAEALRDLVSAVWSATASN